MTPFEWAMIIAAVVAAAGTAYSGEQQRKAASVNADIAQQNAIAAQQKAAFDEERHRDQLKKLMSSQRSLYGKSGVDMSGSPLLVMEDTAAEGELDALAIRYGGNVEAAQQRSAANLYRMQGGAAATSGYIQAGSTLLQGAANVKQSQFRRENLLQGTPKVTVKNP